jgi:hypothetical protein
MPGSIDYNPGPMTQLAVDATTIGVFLYDDSQENGSRYTLLPNIGCEQIQYKEGVDPPSARFRYLLDELAGANGWPSQFDQIWSLAVAPSPYVVGSDDQLVVLALLPDNTTRVLFHGFARIPQTDLTSSSQAVTFVAAGVAIRCWDTPIGGRPQRNADDPQNGAVVIADLPFRFNPADNGPRAIGGFLPNCTPVGYDVNQAGENPYPVFLDPNLDRDPDPRTFWDLSKAVRTILAIYNTQTDDSLVDNPDFGVLDVLLQNRRPLDGSEFYDPSNPATYQTDFNVIRDYDATNQPWPTVVADLLGFHGFGMRWVCEDDQYGQPYDYLEIYRKDAAGPTSSKQVYLPATGSKIGSSNVNLAAFHAAFDFQSVANEIVVETRPKRYEVSVVLAAGFQPAASDNTAANRGQFRKSFIDVADTYFPGLGAVIRAKYRLYLADECGDGHWSFANSAWINTPVDLSAIFPANQDGSANYVRRYRPGENTLLTQDLNNRPKSAQLALSRDYAGADPPCVWDGTGTWQTINGGWRLVEDKLGIEVTVDDPEAWDIGKPPPGSIVSKAQEPTGVLHGITSIANPVQNVQSMTRFTLRLTTVIEADQDLGIIAPRRDASPIDATIQRRVDARDQFRFGVVKANTAFNATSQDVTIYDDSDAATTHAMQLRSAHEFPPLTGTVTIPMLVNYLQVGDQIQAIDGRDVSFQINAAGEQQEAPSYPYIVALTWNFQGDRQSTLLQLSDRRLEPL